MDRDDNRPQDDDFQDQDQAYDDQGYATNVQHDQEFENTDEWQEQPVDDFADEAEAGDMHALPEEENPDEFQQLPDDGLGDGIVGDDDQQPMAAAKNAGASGGIGRYLPLAGGVAAMLVLGFFAWNQMSGMLTAKNAAPQADGGFNTPTQIAENNPPPAPPITPPDSMLTGQPVPPIPGQVVEQPTPLPNIAENQPTQPVTELPPPAQVAELPPPVQVAPPPPVVIEAPVAQQPVTQPPVTVPATPDPQVSELSRQLEEARAREASLSSQVQALQQNSNQSSEAAQATIRSLEDKVTQLEQRLNAPVLPTAAVPTKNAPSSGSSSSSSSSPSTSSSPVASLGDKPSRAFQRKSKPKTASRSDSGDGDQSASRLQREVNSRFGGAPVPPQHQPMPVVQNPGFAGAQAVPQYSWILRSAQPGSAWLSLGGSNNLRRVAPGDKVQGLGTIVSVRQVAGRWVVEGTEATVR